MSIWRNGVVPRPRRRGKRGSVGQNKLEKRGPARQSASSSPRNSPARFPVSRSRRSNRGCSRSTPRKAPARPVTGLGESLEFDVDLVVPNTRALPLKQGRGRALGQDIQPAEPLLCCKRSPGRCGISNFRSTRPGAIFRRTIIAMSFYNGTQGLPITSMLQGWTAQAMTSKSRSKAYRQSRTGAWRETESAWMREELGKFQSASAVRHLPAATRLKPEALAVKLAEEDISMSFARMPDRPAPWPGSKTLPGKAFNEAAATNRRRRYSQRKSSSGFGFPE